jgi:caspase-like apoptosis-related cysteine protease
MSHGEAGYLYARDTMYQPQELWLRFTGDRCPTMVGKPKLFFIQVSRQEVPYLPAY